MTKRPRTPTPEPTAPEVYAARRSDIARLLATNSMVHEVLEAIDRVAGC